MRPGRFQPTGTRAARSPAVPAPAGVVARVPVLVLSHRPKETEMTRRRVTATVRCAKPGCPETAYFEYDSQRERQESDRWRKDHPWRCYRHTREDEVLSPTNPERTAVLTAVKVESHGRTLRGLYWQAEGASPTSGLVDGPGFKAIASDLPEGARLIVTARIELPTTAEVTR